MDYRYFHFTATVDEVNIALLLPVKTEPSGFADLQIATADLAAVPTTLTDMCTALMSSHTNFYSILAQNYFLTQQ